MDKKYDPRRLADREEKSNVTLRWWGPIVQRRGGGRAGGAVGGGGGARSQFQNFEFEKAVNISNFVPRINFGLLCAYDL